MSQTISVDDHLARILGATQPLPAHDQPPYDQPLIESVSAGMPV